MLFSEIAKYALMLPIFHWFVMLLVWNLLLLWNWTSSECYSSANTVLTRRILYYGGLVLYGGDISISVEYYR